MTLFKRCRPSHISRFIVAVIINSVNAQFYTWSRTDMLKKQFKIVNPSTIYNNTPSPIIFITFVFRVTATLLHLLPCKIFLSWFMLAGRAFTIITVPVSESPIRHFFRTETPTTFCMSIFKVLIDKTLFRPAIAPAQRITLSVFPWQWFENGKPTKSLPGQIKWRSHAPILLGDN